MTKRLKYSAVIVLLFLIINLLSGCVDDLTATSSSALVKTASITNTPVKTVAPTLSPTTQLISPTLVPTIQPTIQPTVDPLNQIVYKTNTGEKYHRDGCRYLSKSKIQITLRQAKASGLGPCSVCNPPF